MILVAALFLVAAYKLNDIVAALKPKIITAITDATDGKVNFDALDVHAFPSPHIELKNLALELPLGLKAKVDSVSTSVSLSSIFSGSLEVTSVGIKNLNGVFQNGTAPKPIDFNKLNFDASATVTQEGVSIQKATASGTVLSTIPFSLSSSSIGFNLSTKALAIDSATVKIPAGDIVLKGSAGGDKLSLSFNGSKLSVKELLGMAAVFAPQVVSLPLNGDLRFEGNANGLPPKVNSDTNASVTFNSVPISFGTKSVFEGKSLSVDSIDVTTAGGSLKGSSNINLASLLATLSITGGGFDIQQLVKLGGAAVPVTGKISGIKLDSFATNPTLSEFSGTGNVTAATLSIPGVNLFGRVVDKMKAIPGLSETLLHGLSPAARSAIESNATELSSGVVDFAGRGNSILLNRIEGASALFTISGSGSVVPASKSGSVSLTMYLSQELSSSLVATLKGGTGFMEQGRIKIPVDVSFSPAGVSVSAKVDNLLKGAAIEAGKQILNRALSGDAKGAKDLIGGILGF